MIRLNLREIVDIVGGRVGDAQPVGTALGVSTDSRTVGADELFFALAGERFDGHEYVHAALARGAIGAVVARERLPQLVADAGAQPASADRPLIGVDDPAVALGRLGRYHRDLLSAHVIAVVGSNGKTTTKRMIDHVLAARLTGRCSPKSFNNAIGVPLTLLSAEASDEYLVVEIGTNAPGEIAALTDLVRPSMVVLTCVGEEHLEGLGDFDGVVREECAVFAGLSGGFAAVNIDEPRVRSLAPQLGAAMTTFGACDEADLRLTSTRVDAKGLAFEVNGRFAYRLAMPGAHNAVNALGAIAVARRLGFEHEEIAARLATFVPPPMRCETMQCGGVTIINDAYNANPQSMAAAVALLEQQPCDGRRIMVVGEMRELGAAAAERHADLARRLRSAALDAVVLVGAAAEMMQDAWRSGSAAGPALHVCADVAAVGELLVATARPGDCILLKASRTVKLEDALPPLRRRFAAIETG